MGLPALGYSLTTNNWTAIPDTDQLNETMIMDLSGIVIANAPYSFMLIQSIIDELILERILPKDWLPDGGYEIWEAFEDDFEWDDIDTVEVDGERFYIQKIE